MGHNNRVIALLIAVLFLAWPAHARSFQMNWEGTRRWVGNMGWASPLYDWRVEDGTLVGDAGSMRFVQNFNHWVRKPDKAFTLETAVKLDMDLRGNQAAQVWAGFAVGIKGLMDNQQHTLVGPKQFLRAGIRGDGKAFVGDNVSAQKIDPSTPADLSLKWDGKGLLILRVTQNGKTIQTQKAYEPDKLKGNIALAAIDPQRDEMKEARARAYFSGGWRGEGDAILRTVTGFGPILWTQYTRQGNEVKVLAMLPPMGEKDPKKVRLEIREGFGWKPIDTQEYDPLTYTALLRGTVPDGKVEYRVSYQFGKVNHGWVGNFIPDPATTGEPLKIGVFSCDHGYAFPLPTMVENVKKHKPNLVFFAGDQIYEGYGGFKLKREPTELAMLDYLRKYYQFGLTWRYVFRDTPCIIIPDDHDVFQGNIWGADGKWTKDIQQGGYVMHPDWVNGVQRTQTAHLPDPHDPTPVKRNIGVYYTDFTWGGVPIALIEDRKWKNGPNQVLPKGDKKGLAIKQVDPEGAQLLGERQEAFLNEWSKRTAGEPLRMVMSQTIFCKGHTHTGPNLRKNHYDWDSNGWPHSGRQRALAPFKDSKTFMLHGDQHLGLLVRQGVDQHNDGPYAFMVPGTSNGWPRAWWPNEDKAKIKGDFVDPFGNKFSVLAAANPEPGTNQLKTRDEGNPEESAHRKGSGYGLVVVDPKTHAVTFNMYRYLFDAGRPKKGEQFPGFPVTIQPE